MTQQTTIDYKTASKILRDYAGWKVLKETIIVYFKEEYNLGYIYGFKKSKKKFITISHTEAKPIYLVKEAYDYTKHLKERGNIKYVIKYHYEIYPYAEKRGLECVYRRKPILITTIKTNRKIIYSDGTPCSERELLEEIGTNHPVVKFTNFKEEQNYDSTFPH